MSLLGERIKQLRTAAGMSQADLARAVGISQNAVSMWEKGERQSPRGDSLLKLARALGVEPGSLFEVGPPVTPTLTLDQQRVLDIYKQLSTSRQEIAIRLLKALR